MGINAAWENGHAAGINRAACFHVEVFADGVNGFAFYINVGDVVVGSGKDAAIFYKNGHIRLACFNKILKALSCRKKNES